MAVSGLSYRDHMGTGAHVQEEGDSMTRALFLSIALLGGCSETTEHKGQEAGKNAGSQIVFRTAVYIDDDLVGYACVPVPMNSVVVLSQNPKAACP
jgi:hypothetical protein